MMLTFWVCHFHCSAKLPVHTFGGSFALRKSISFIVTRKNMCVAIDASKVTLINFNLLFIVVNHKEYTPANSLVC